MFSAVLFVWCDIIFAQTTGADTTGMSMSVDITSWINVITSSGFGGLVWYLIAKGMPAMQERFDARSEQAELSWEKRLDNLQAFFKEELKNREAVFEKTIERILKDKEK